MEVNALIATTTKLIEKLKTGLEGVKVAVKAVVAGTAKMTIASCAAVEMLSEPVLHQRKRHLQLQQTVGILTGQYHRQKATVLVQIEVGVHELVRLYQILLQRQTDGILTGQQDLQQAVLLAPVKRVKILIKPHTTPP